MVSGSFASVGGPQPPQQQAQQAQQQAQQAAYQVGTMDMGLGYPSAAAAAAAAAMGEAYRSSGQMFGRLDYQAQAQTGDGRPPPQRRRRQQQQNSGPAPQAPMGPPDKQQQQQQQHHQQQHMGQFGILAPTPVPVPHPHGTMQPAMAQQTLHFSPAMQTGAGPGDGTASSTSAPMSQGKLKGKIVVDPPDLETWREKLFHVDEMIVLTQEQ